MGRLKIFILLLLILFCSCRQDNIVIHDDIDDISFTVDDFEEEFSRTDINITSTGVQFLWKAGDVIGVFPQNGYQTAFAITSGIDSKTAAFNGNDWALKPNTMYGAYFPFIERLDFDKTTIPVNYNGQKQQADNTTNHLGSYDFLAAGFSNVNSNGYVNFQMKHLGALVKFDITVKDPGIYTKLIISSYNGFPLTAYFNLSDLSQQFNQENNKREITLELNNITTVSANQEIVLYMMVPPSDCSSGKITVSLVKNDGTVYKCRVNGKNFTAGKAYRIAAAVTDNTTIGGHDYIDLGLPSGNLWAKFNMGATKVEDYGQLYAWGEVFGYNDEHTDNQNNYNYAGTWVKTYYYLETYKFSKNNSLSNPVKYNNTDKKTVLDIEDEAVAVNWGSNWRIPAPEDFEELFNDLYTKKESKTLNGVAGLLLISKINGETLFIPYSGYRNKNVSSRVGGKYFLWTNKINSSNISKATDLYGDYYIPCTIGEAADRYTGMSIRAVYKE